MPKVLIVDDSRATRSLLTRIFVAQGYEVLQAENGVQGIEVLQASAAVDLVCVDWNMPQMTGIEMTRRLRGTPRFHRTPIMMITMETHALIMGAAMQAGINEYLMKPFNTETIVHKLRILDCPIQEGVGARG